MSLRDIDLAWAGTKSPGGFSCIKAQFGRAITAQGRETVRKGGVPISMRKVQMSKYSAKVAR